MRSENTEREQALKILLQAENKIFLAGRALIQKTVMFKQDIDAMKNIEKALAEVLKASKNLKAK